MATYRKKPIEVKAEQFFPDRKPWPDGVHTIRWHTADPTSWTGFRIETPDGWVAVSLGDWIIAGVKGDRYPCKPDIFEASYEQVEPYKPEDSP